MAGKSGVAEVGVGRMAAPVPMRMLTIWIMVVRLGDDCESGGLVSSFVEGGMGGCGQGWRVEG